MRIVSATAATMSLAIAMLGCADALDPSGITAPHMELPSVASATSAAWPSEPAGLTTINERAFDSKATRSSDLQGSDGWSTSEHRFPNFRIVDDAGAPHSPLSVGEIVYPRGFRGGGGPAQTEVYLGNRYRTLYAGLWIKLSPNFQGHRSGNNVVARTWVGGRGGPALLARGAGNGTLVPAVAHGAVQLVPNVASTAAVPRGEWQRWEVILRVNTPGRRDGAVVWWLDGVKVMEYTELQFVTGTPDTWDAFVWAPAWGGTGDAVAQDMSMRWDHVRLAGSADRLLDLTPPPPAEALRIEPSALSLAVGATAQLTVVEGSSSGTTLVPTSVSWTVADPAVATVSSSGIVTGIASGSTTVAASSGGRVATASVTVAAIGGAPEPVDTIFHERFESGTVSAWHDGYDPARHRIVTDPAGSATAAGGKVLEVTYPPNTGGGWLTRFFMPGYDAVRVRYAIRLAPDWAGQTALVGLLGSRTDNQWSAFGQGGRCPNGTNYFASSLVAEAASGGAPGLRFYTSYPAMPRAGDGTTCWGSQGIGTASYSEPLALTPGVWHTVEFSLKANTPGSADGSQRFWLDGVLRGEWNGLDLRSSDILRINSLQLTFNTCCGVPATRRVYIDDVLVTTGPVPDAPPPPPPPPPPAVASVSVSPSVANVEIGRSVQLTATVRDERGTTLTGRTVTWSSSNTAAAAVSTNGTVTGRGVGQATITATSEGRSGSSTVTVVSTPPPPPVVASVSVAPATSTIPVGGSAQFTATVRDAGGTVLQGRTVTWASSNTGVATVSGTGLATARGAGSATITATSEGQNGTASLTVTADEPPPPPPPPGGGGSQEPAGFTELARHGYDALPGPGGWYLVDASGNARLVTDATSPGASPSVLETIQPAGMVAGGAGAVSSGLNWGQGVRELYSSYWMKLNPTYQSIGIQKINYIGYGYTEQTLIFEVYDQSPPYRTSWVSNITGQRIDDNTPAGFINPGQWHRYEFYMRWNTAAGNDGILRWWVDGVLRGDRRDMQYGSPTSFDGFREWRYSNIWGGTAGVKRATDWIRFDDVYVSGK